MSKGRIVKALSGFYYVRMDGELLRCRARGKFRKDGLSPLVGDQVEVMEKLDASDYQIQRIEYGDACAAGNDLGKGIEDAVGGLFDFDLGTGEDYGAGFTMDDIANNAALTAENTGATADALTASNEELAYLRDIAEREAINRFTTAEVRIDMTGMTNRIEGSADLDGVISELTNGFTEALVTAAEGVHT